MGVFTKSLKYALGGVSVATFCLASSELASASGAAALPASYSWPHTGVTTTYDYAAVRRGFSVYKQVCSACHSMKFLSFRHLINVTHTEAEVKEMAAEYEIEHDAPNEQGEMYMRARTTNDNFPAPYPNEIAARLGNNGALPPDLSLIRNARTHEMDFHYGEDYIFHLLTGYMDPPAGVEVAEGMHYNPYFKGGAIGMGAPLYPEIIQYDDGTPATLSQLASDVCQFLTWSSMKHDDERKSNILKMWPAVFVFMVGAILAKKNDWAGLKPSNYQFRNLKQKTSGMYNGKPRY